MTQAVRSIRRLRRALVACLAAVGLACAAPGAASAQSLIPEQGLRFGTLQPGVAKHVGPNDPERAHLTIVGFGRMGIRVLPPAALATPGGATMPFEIGVGDAVIRWLGGSPQVLVPGRTTTTNGFLFGAIYIGGTVRPALDQGAGTYSGAIVVQVVAPGT